MSSLASTGSRSSLVSSKLKSWKKKVEKRADLRQVLKKPPNYRSESDVEAIVAHLGRIAFFQQFPTDYLRSACSTFRHTLVTTEQKRISMYIPSAPFMS